MFKNHLTIAFRSLLKYKGSSFINIFGLSIGMAVFLLIAMFTRFEKSYEDFIPNADNIYRLTLEQYMNEELQIASAENYPGAGPALKNDLPEVTGYSRLYNMGYKNNVIITNKEAQPEPIAFKQRHFLYADSSFLPMMGYGMVSGDRTTALAEPLSAVISEKYAKLYFGSENPIGKFLQLQDDDYNDELVKVTGVFKDLPANTHLKFDVLFSYKTLYTRGEWAPGRYHQSWQRKDMYTFISVKPGTDPKVLEVKFPSIVDNYNPELKKENRRDVLALQPIKDIHLHSDLAEEPESNGDARIVFFMSLIGFFVLAIAWINYINLSTARAIERAKEVGIRKVVGALKGHLIGQFLVEAALVNLVAILFTWGLLWVVLPYFNSLAGLSLEPGTLIQPWFLAMMLALWVAGSLLSGFYPALVLSGFQPVKILKGTYSKSQGGTLLRKGLVVVQFMASVILIIGTLTIYRQLDFMLNKDIGVDVDQVLVVERPGISSREREVFNSAVDVFRTEINKHPGIKAISSSATIPGKQREYKVGAKKYGSPDSEMATLRFNSMDYDFLDVFKMKVIAGRAFSKDHPADPDTSVILTEKSTQLLGFENPEDAIGKTVDMPRFRWTAIVVGVVNDYHQVSLKKAVSPSIFYCSPYRGEFYSLRIQTDNLSGVIDHTSQAWRTAFPGNPFEYFFLDEYFNRQYQNEKRFGNLSLIFALLAIFLGCMGLFGLSGYTTLRRTKEIGIRKVLGASPEGIVFLLSKDTLILIFVAIIAAFPIAWWVMNQWLENFAYRIEMEWLIFAIAGLLTVGIAFLTVGYQSLKAAMANPAESMRTE